MSALLSRMVETVLYINLEVSSAFNFGLKPEAGFDSASVAHRLISPLIFWLRRVPGLGHQRDDRFHSPREQQMDGIGLLLRDLSLMPPYFGIFWSSLRLAVDNTFLRSPSFFVGCVILTSQCRRFPRSSVVRRSMRTCTLHYDNDRQQQQQTSKQQTSKQQKQARRANTGIKKKKRTRFGFLHGEDLLCIPDGKIRM